MEGTMLIQTQEIAPAPSVNAASPEAEPRLKIVVVEVPEDDDDLALARNCSNG